MRNVDAYLRSQQGNVSVMFLVFSIESVRQRAGNNVCAAALCGVLMMR